MFLLLSVWERGLCLVAGTWHLVRPSFCFRVKPYWVSWPSYLKGYSCLTHCRFLTWGHSTSWRKDFKTCAQQHNQPHYVTCFMLHPCFIESCFWHICFKGICVLACCFSPRGDTGFWKIVVVIGGVFFFTLWSIDQFGEVYFLSTNVVLTLNCWRPIRIQNI